VKPGDTVHLHYSISLAYVLGRVLEVEADRVLVRLCTRSPVKERWAPRSVCKHVNQLYCHDTEILYPQVLVPRVLR
jgi:hypothetical protein